MANFDITWSIHNFHFCWHKTGEWLESSLFQIDLDDETFWRLRLYPRGEDDGEYLSYYLFREKGGPKVVEVDFELSLKFRSKVICETVLKRRSFEVHQRDGIARLTPRCLILPTNAAAKDTFDLNFKCLIYNRNKDLFERSFRMMLTRIEMGRIYGTEIFDDDKDINPDFNKDIEIKPMLEDESVININLSYVDKSLVVKIRPVSCKKIKYAILKITVIQNGRKKLPIEHIRSWIGEIKADTWRNRALLPERDSGTPDIGNSNDKAFFVHYDFAFSVGEMGEYCESEYAVNVRTYCFPIQQYFNARTKTAPTALRVLKDVYESQSFVDFDFELEKTPFPVHKAILCARSPMLNFVMNLNHTAVELTPLEYYEGQKLISFLYTDSVEISSLLIAGELYSIASFLKIKLLKTKCRNFLKDKLDVHHLSQILSILFVIRDFSLKTAVENFILKHYDLILQYTNKKILEEVPELHKEIIRLKYKKQKTIPMYDVDYE